MAGLPMTNLPLLAPRADELDRAPRSVGDAKDTRAKLRADTMRRGCVPPPPDPSGPPGDASVGPRFGLPAATAAARMGEPCWAAPPLAAGDSCGPPPSPVAEVKKSSSRLSASSWASPPSSSSASSSAASVTSRRLPPPPATAAAAARERAVEMDKRARPPPPSRDAGSDVVMAGSGGCATVSAAFLGETLSSVLEARAVDPSSAAWESASACSNPCASAAAYFSSSDQ